MMPTQSRPILFVFLLLLFTFATTPGCSNTAISPDGGVDFCHTNDDCKALGADHTCVLNICMRKAPCGGRTGQACLVPGKSGACANGKTACENEKIICVPNDTTKLTELCGNRIDDDCDGQIDETPPCTCTPGESRLCYPEGTVGCQTDSNSASGYTCKGSCRVGVQTCRPGEDLSQWGPCVGSETPSIEVCDGKDNDCNGPIDDGDPGAGKACSVADQKGPCASGKTVCKGGKTQCEQTVQPKDKEECGNAIDDNCNGQVDEDCACNPGEVQKCYTGPETAKGKGECKEGTQTCGSNGKWGECLGSVLPSRELCDGKDNDCNGETDEDFPQKDQDCTVTGQKGPCAKGKSACKDGKLECAQTVQPQKEICDGQDNDCTGTPDEGCDCVDGSIRSCSSNNPGCVPDGKGFKCTGACKTGTQTCAGGKWGACSGEVKPAAKETCDNGVDENCNGQADENPPCTCTAGQTQPCGQDQGECKKGIQTCEDGNYGACTGAINPTQELCDSKDNDCDGKTDEDFSDLGQSCTVGQGECQRTGNVVCAPDGKGTTCTAKPGAKGTEACNGKDDDCDGSIDEDWPNLNKNCTVGRGECERTGKTICRSNGNGTRCNATAGTPKAEDCNGKDDDCDGQVDESLTRQCYTKGSGCTQQGDGSYRCNGICKAGTQTCSNQQWSTCSGDTGPGTETCDSKDNDCDGQTDEGGVCAACTANTETRSCYTGPTGTEGVGTCKGATQTCDSSGEWPKTCSGEVTPLANETDCDNKDEDCDGQIDEGLTRSCYSGPGGTKNVGECKEGTQTCSAGSWGTCTGEVKPATETCDSKDNDCNGQIDEGIPNLTCGVGECRRNVAACSNGTTQTCTPGNSSDEICGSGKDEDCDGDTDYDDAACCLPSSSGVVTIAAGDAHADKIVYSIAADPTADRFASSGEKNGPKDNIRIWNLQGTKQLGITEDTSMNDVAYSPDGTIVAGAGADHRLRLWNSTTGVGLLQDHRGGQDVYDVATARTSTGGLLVAASWKDKVVNLYFLSLPGLSALSNPSATYSGGVGDIALDPTGRYLVVGGLDNNVYLAEAASGGSNETLNSHSGPVNAVAVSPDGAFIASGSNDKTVKIWTVNASNTSDITATLTRTLSGSNGDILSLAFHPVTSSGTPTVPLIAAGTSDGKIHIWDYKKGGAALATINAHSGKVNGLAFNRDGKTLISGSDDKTIKIWKCP